MSVSFNSNRSTFGPYAGGDNTRFSQKLFSTDETKPIRSEATDFKQEILRARTEYRKYHSRRLMTHKSDQNYFTLEYFTPSPDQNRDPLKASTGYELVNQMQAHIGAEPPTVMVLPRSKTKAGQTQASRQQAWINGMLSKSDVTRWVRDVLWHGCVRGCAILRVLYDESRWPLEPEPPVEPQEPEHFDPSIASEATTDYVDELLAYDRAKQRYEDDLAEYKDRCDEIMPFLIQVLDPQYVLWEPGDDPQQCIVVWERVVDEIAQRYPDTRQYLGQFESGTKVTWCEFWDRDVYAYWIEPGGASYSSSGSGAPYWVQDPEEHGYGFFPFIIDGPWPTPLQDPDKHYPSIYFAIKSLLQYESTLLTQMAHIFRKLGWPILLINTPEARNDTQLPRFDAGPGKMNFLGEDEHASYLEMGGSTMTLLERIINGMGDQIQTATGLRDVLQGQPKGKSGYQQAQVAAQARVALVPVEHFIQRMLKKLTRYLFKLITVADMKITVMSLETTRDSETALGPKDVAQVGPIRVALKTILPIDEGAKVKNYLEMQKAQWFSPIEAARLAGIENPEDKAEGAEIYGFEHQPPIMMAKALVHVQKNDPETWAIMQQFGLVEKMLASLEGPPPGAQGPPGQGGPGKGLPGAPRPPAGPGSAEEAGQVHRQGRQGGRAPKNLPPEEGAA